MTEPEPGYFFAVRAHASTVFGSSPNTVTDESEDALTPAPQWELLQPTPTEIADARTNSPIGFV